MDTLINQDYYIYGQPAYVDQKSWIGRIEKIMVRNNKKNKENQLEQIIKD